MQPFACPTHIFLPVLRNSQAAEFIGWKIQFLPVVGEPILNSMTGMYNGAYLPGWRCGCSRFTGGDHRPRFTPAWLYLAAMLSKLHLDKTDAPILLCTIFTSRVVFPVYQAWQADASYRSLDNCGTLQPRRYSSVVEHRPCKSRVVGSSPTTGSIFHSLVPIGYSFLACLLVEVSPHRL